MDVLINLIIAILISALVLYVVARLNLGIAIKNFSTAVIAAIVIAVISTLMTVILNSLGITLGGGLLGALLNLIVAAIVLMVSGSFLSGMVVNGFTGALIAALAIGFFTWLLGFILGSVGILTTF